MSLLSNSKIRENAEGRRALDDRSFHRRYRSLHKSSRVDRGCNYNKWEFPAQEALLFRDVLTSKYFHSEQAILELDTAASWNNSKSCCISTNCVLL
jgi:hypothetical protein